MDDQVTYAQQLQHDGGPVVLINQFTLAPAGTGRSWRCGPTTPRS